MISVALLLSMMDGMLLLTDISRKQFTGELMKTNQPKILTEKAIFAAGCFWHVQTVFDELPGVISTIVGYTGGQTEDPTYQDVGSHTTGHAEAVLVEYDPEKISYEKLLDIFWTIHDPTTVDRQGPDVGSQYRSAIFYHDEKQEKTAQQYATAQRMQTHSAAV